MQSWCPETYDAVFPDPSIPQWELPIYRALARNADGPVLELGCGTGRIVEDLCRTGVDAYGIDCDPEMVGAARRRLQTRGLAVERICPGDMRRFEHHRRYGLVALPFNTLPMLLDDRDVLRTLHCTAKHLRPGGTFVFDAMLPEPHDRAFREQRSVRLVGEHAELDIEGSYEHASGRLECLHTLRPAGRPARRIATSQQLRSTRDLRAMLEHCGFVVRAVDENGHEPTPASRWLVATAIRPG